MKHVLINKTKNNNRALIHVHPYKCVRMYVLFSSSFEGCATLFCLSAVLLLLLLLQYAMCILFAAYFAITFYPFTYDFIL